MNRNKLKQWAIEVKAKANGFCELCKRPATDAHHVISRHILLTRFDLRNGVATCKKHHKFCKYTSAHSGSMYFISWFMANRPDDYKYLMSTIPI